jgi:hypothetical protein
MRIPALHRTSVGFFAAISLALLSAWVVSWFSVFYLTIHPNADTELVAGCVRGRAAFHWRYAWNQETPGFNGQWYGMPAKLTDVLGTFYFEHFDGPALRRPRLAYIGIEAPVPPTALAAGSLALLIRRRFQVTLRAWLSTLVVFSALFAFYASTMPTTRQEVDQTAPTEPTP